ncbi:hypothetical protein NEOLEDRAFT_1079250 [Neolentinus lepideus HHB14362 ss-1]|uniref:Uncharacterized protein n=1 Tax=Neolentinus lepideus HHB14362 ss-1 TaxID=1314782 RepID=A0A165MV40_9AGAM|nr:hypothetical protein NEOLEDRAFT_1079250 [Neolentinus lepideus HHB14362 ss-1]
MSASQVYAIPSLSKGKKKSKGKEKSKSSKVVASAVSDPKPRNESESPHWAYKPPEGSVEIEYNVEQEDFDWDAVKNDENLELWVIRAPDGLKTKYLEGVELDSFPSTSHSARIGTIDKKHTSYDIWSVGEEDDDGSPDFLIVGEEMKRLSCLLPRAKKGGKLYQAFKPVSRRIVVTTKSALPTLEHSSDSSASETRSAPRQRYPSELLTHRFTPYGSLSAVDNSDGDAMDVDALQPPPSTQVLTNLIEKSLTQTKKHKKRKDDGEGDASKKSKKAKK